MERIETNRPHIGNVIVRPSDPERRRFRVKPGSAIVFCPRNQDGTTLVVVDTGNATGISTGGHAALEEAAKRYMGQTPQSRKEFNSRYSLVRASIDLVTFRSQAGTDKKGFVFSALGLSSLDSTR